LSRHHFIDRDLSAGLKVMKEIQPIKGNNKIYQWQQSHGLLAELPQPVAAQAFPTSIIPWSASSKEFFVNLLKGSEWQLIDSTSALNSETQQLVNRSAPLVSLLHSSARLWAGDKQAILWLTDKIEQPILQPDRWIVKVKISADTVPRQSN
jgi:hypothetical protein